MEVPNDEDKAGCHGFGGVIVRVWVEFVLCAWKVGSWIKCGYNLGAVYAFN